MTPKQRITARMLMAGMVGCILLPSPAPADAETTPRLKGVEVNGIVSTSFNYSLNRPGSRTNLYRVFDVNEGDFQFDVAEVVVQKNPVAPGEGGFRFDLDVGSSVPRISAAAGLFRSDSGRAEDVDLHQAMVSYIVPIGRGVRLDLGKHVTHLGYEVIEGYDGLNEQTTHSFLFGYSIPFTHTGIRAGYAPSSRLAGALYLVNGWDNVRDNNRAKSAGAQIVLTPGAGVTLVANYLGGAEQRDNTSNLRHIVDLVGTYKPSGRVSFGINLDYGTEAKALGSGGDATWQGAVIYPRVAVGRSLAIGARGEVFDDKDGYRTGVKQRLAEVTLTPELKLARGFLLRADFRVDRSNQMVFERDKEPASRKSQQTIMLNAIYVF